MQRELSGCVLDICFVFIGRRTDSVVKNVQSILASRPHDEVEGFSFGRWPILLCVALERSLRGT